MDDMYKSIKAFLYDRTSSPLFGAFLLSWLLVNFKIVLTIFSGEDLTTKFHIIDNLFSNIPFFEYQSLWLGTVIYSFVLPAILTGAYIYIYPFLAKPVYQYSLRRQIELRKVKQEEEGNRVLTIEESQEIYREMAEVENKYSLQEEKHRKQVESLLSKIEENEGSESKKSNVVERVKDLELSRRVPPYDRMALNKYKIKDKIDQLPEGTFSFEQLIGEKDWSALDDGEKRKLGRQFNRVVKAGGYFGVSYEGENSSNHAQYLKRVISKPKAQEKPKLSELKEEILSYLGSAYNRDLDKSDFHRLDHVVKVDLALDELDSEGYLTTDGRGFYILTNKSRKYLVDNNLIKT